MPKFLCDVSEEGRDFSHFWEHTVGSGHAPLALRADWQAQLKRAQRECGFRYVRFHGLLSGAMQTLFIHEDEYRYSFFNVDRIYDFLLSVGIRPFVELSFMPEALASGDETVFNYVNHVSPPEDYEKWGQLIHEFVSHCIARYGLEEVRRWYFEVWNEPNLEAFWAGDQADYFKLYRVTVETIKAIDEALPVGGPSSARNEWIPEFLDYCEEHDLPVDFITTHHYPTDAFGSPDDDTTTQLAKSERSILRREAETARSEAGDKPLFYTEWNSSSNPRDARHDLPYTAAFVVKTIMEAQGLVDGYSFWTFSDIFEENYMPSQPFHGGFGLLNLYGVPKPVYRAYQLLHRLGDKQLKIEGDHETVDGWAVRKNGRVDLLFTNHALPKHPVDREEIEVRLRGVSPEATVKIARIDQDHANPRRVWEEIGAPDYLSDKQVADLEIASQLCWEPLAAASAEDDQVAITFAIPPQGVAAVTIISPGVNAIDIR
jgi:xylan 1,4-beta-xylosidase